MKVIIFSHGADIDGMGSIILAKLAFGNVDYVCAENIDYLGPIISNYLKNSLLYKYNNIFVTDLAIPRPVVDEININDVISNKIKVFDHHKTSIDAGLANYPFVKIVPEDDKGKRCGTDLFYEYLVKEGYIKPTKCLDEFVELTRLVDTWEWKNAGEKGIKAGDLAVLFNAIGREDYILSMINNLSSKNEFDLTSKEKETVKLKREEQALVIKALWIQREYFIDELGNKYAALFSKHEYTGDLIEFVRGLSEDIKYLVTIDLDKGEYGQKSYRNVDETFDVSEIAKLHGGGGHMAASGVNITSEQKEYASTLDKKEALKYLVDASYEIEKTK